VLTARSEDMDAAPALNLGADDYVTKPFSAEVLLARINANLRKSVVREVGEPDVVKPLLIKLISNRDSFKKEFGVTNEQLSRIYGIELS
jgi:two-component system KDP operon response regulator KdpE